jgi:hypothetical protein
MRVIGERVLALLPTRSDLASTLHQPRKDLVAGLTVAIVALPFALGFGISSGLGAAAGEVVRRQRSAGRLLEYLGSCR